MLPDGKFTVEHPQWCLFSGSPNRYQQRGVQECNQQQKKHIDAHEYDSRILPTERKTFLQMQWKTSARICAIEICTLSPMNNCGSFRKHND